MMLHGSLARRPHGRRVVAAPAWLALGMALMTALTVLAPVWGDGFAVPGSSGWATWEAENAADAAQVLMVADPSASGGRYVDSAEKAGVVLEFPFVAKEAAKLRVRPVWWRTGDATAARMYPYPLSPNPGPDCVVADGSRVFFTAPQAGRVAVADVASGQVIGSVEIGGYLTDLLMDGSKRWLYVSDALGDRVVIVDADKMSVVGVVATPPEPWSMVPWGGGVLVACRGGRLLAVVDTSKGKVTRTVRMPAPPINLELVSEPSAMLVVRFQQPALDAQDLTVLPADELQYGGAGERTSVSVGREKRYSRQEAHVLRVEKGGQVALMDVSEVTKMPPVAEKLDYPLSNDPGPSRMEICGKYLFFTCPASGRVGVVSIDEDKVVKAISVGGYLSDIVAAPRAEIVYVSDALGNRVVGIDVKKLEATVETVVPAQPWSLAYFDQAAIQRPYMVPPISIEKVYVACRTGKAVVALDAKSGQVVKTVGLQAPARRVRPVPMPSPDWWGGRIDDRVEFALHPRVAVELWPVYLDPKTLEPMERPVREAGEWAARRVSANVSLGGGAQENAAVAAANEQMGQPKLVEVKADNALVLRVGDRWVDVSQVADPQLGSQRALTARDKPGALTMAMDNGPQYDWTRGMWITADSQMFLVNDSEEYWAWNAPTFDVKPGKHVLKIKLRNPHTRLDAVKVERWPGWLQLEALPLPRQVHQQVPLPGYQGLFYYNEPVRFELQIANRGGRQKTVKLEATVENYMGEEVMRRRTVLVVAPSQVQQEELEVESKDMGRFVLTLKASTEDGEVVKKVRYVRLARLEHPRLIVRRDDLAEVRERVARYPRLYERYVNWLRRQAPKGGNWPERFLPPGVTRVEMGKAAPDEMKDVSQREQAYGWRMYEAAWRMLAVEFAAMYLEPKYREELMRHLEPLLQAKSTDYYCQYHHHGPLFPGAVAALVDMAPEEVLQTLPLYAFLKAKRGDMNVMPWTLVTLEEPLTPENRALIWRLGMFANNLEQYFMTHQGYRGGTWWQNPWTGCHCPVHGLLLTFIYFRNFFDEPRLFEKPFFRGYLTFHRYLDPIADKQALLPARRGPLGEPWRWILAALSRHPLEKTLYRWDEWIAKLEGPLPDETEAVDRLMALEGMPYVGPIRGGQHHFTTGVSVPVALALGWYDPQAPRVEWDELPPSALFERDGWAVLRSDWGVDATEVWFNCGTREHTPRGVPNHIMIWRRGYPLIGWPALWGDDGNNTPRWGNVVVAGKEWLKRWQLNLEHPRDREHIVINRFSKPTWTYITRDQRLIGYAPAESGWGGGLDLHGHTQTIYRHEGYTIAYATRPEFDYVAGDGTNAWTLDEVEESYRQVVYVRPDTVVVYDRVRLGTGADTSELLLATGPGVEVGDGGVAVTNGDATLRAVVLLPERAKVSLPDLPKCYQWKNQRLVRIEAAEPQGKDVEYLTVYRTGVGQAPALDARLVRDADSVGVAWDGADGRAVEIRFNRVGKPLGGEVLLGSGAGQVRYVLPQQIEDTYKAWASDPHYRKWVSEARFDFVVRPEDRRP